MMVLPLPSRRGLLALLVGTLLLLAAGNGAEACLDGKLKLIFADEFKPCTSGRKCKGKVNGGINTKTWLLEEGDGSDYNIPGWGNNELECYTSSSKNARVVAKKGRSNDGYLLIQARYSNESIACKNRLSDVTSQRQWTSARLTSRRRAAFMWTPANATGDGEPAVPLYIEAKVKVPRVDGSWPAFWMLSEPPADGPDCSACGKYGPGWCLNGEMDIMEHVNQDTKVCSNLFWGGWRDQSWMGCYSNLECLDLKAKASGWFTAGVKWGPETISYYINKVQYKTFHYSQWFTGGTDKPPAPYAPYDQPFHLLLNLAVGGNFPGKEPQPTKTPWSYQVDYVRVYKVGPNRL